MKRKNGFTLVELLVVISIIALLLSILMPSLSRAREQARRVVCGTRIKQATIALFAYANAEGKYKLPFGAMGGGDSPLATYESGKGWSQLDYMYYTSFEPLKSYLKDTRTLMCNSVPKNIRADSQWTGEPFVPSWNVQSGWKAYWIGYNYLGGHFGQNWPTPVGTAVAWTSPYRLTDSGKLALLADKVSYSTSTYYTYVAHGETGAKQGAPKTEPKVLSPRGGGEVGYMDGSVLWRRTVDMKKHHACNVFGRYSSPITYAYW